MTTQQETNQLRHHLEGFIEALKGQSGETVAASIADVLAATGRRDAHSALRRMPPIRNDKAPLWPATPEEYADAQKGVERQERREQRRRSLLATDEVICNVDLLEEAQAALNEVMERLPELHDGSEAANEAAENLILAFSRLRLCRGPGPLDVEGFDASDGAEDKRPTMGRGEGGAS